MSEYATTVVRLFPDHADSVIWFRGPVPYEQTELDPRLIVDLQVWDASYYAGLNSDYEWHTSGLARKFHTDGVHLARRLADQIGDDFVVQYDDGESHRRVRGSGPPRNQAAAAAFHRMADAAREEGAHLRREVEMAERDGHPLEWHTD